jgi:hypothetical protein
MPEVCILRFAMSVQADSGKTSTPFERALENAGFGGHSGRAEFAVAIGVDAVTVWRWTSGKSQPASLARRAIAKKLKKAEQEIDAMFAESTEAAA